MTNGRFLTQGKSRTLGDVADRFIADGHTFATLHATPLKVVLTGNSLTVQYSPFFQAAIDALRPGEFVSETVAFGGTDAREYAGLIENPQCACGLTDMLSDVLSRDADVIVFMLGTNDSSFVGGVDHFEALVPTFLDAFAGATVIIANPTPVIPSDSFHAFVENNLAGEIDPLIRQFAADRGLPLVDLRAFDWTGLYGDSVHMTVEGRQVMAGIFADAVATVPEPTSLAIAMLSVLLVTARRGVQRGAIVGIG